MKRFYESPSAEIEKFTLTDILTNPQSGQGDFDEEVTLFNSENEF